MKYVAIIEVWHRISSDYLSVRSTQVFECEYGTTVGELIQRVNERTSDAFGCGDLVIKEVSQ